MRSHVTSPLFLIRKRIDNALHYLFPSLFIPLYSMVAFTRIPYRRVVERHNVQQTVIRRGLWGLSLASLGLLGYLIFKFSGMEAALRYRILPCIFKCVVKDYVPSLIAVIDLVFPLVLLTLSTHVQRGIWCVCPSCVPVYS